MKNIQCMFILQPWIFHDFDLFLQRTYSTHYAYTRPVRQCRARLERASNGMNRSVYHRIIFWNAVVSSYYSARLLAGGIKNTLHILRGMTVSNGLGVCYGKQGCCASYCHFRAETRTVRALLRRVSSHYLLKRDYFRIGRTIIIVSNNCSAIYYCSFH